MQILDQYGRPIERRALAGEPQTARLGHLHQEFANHPSRGLTPAKLARILEEAEQGDLVAQFELFDDMAEKDAHIFAEMSKRHRALLGLDWDIVPPRNATPAEEQAAEWVKEVLEDVVALEDLILDLADAIGKGFSCCEIEWELAGREWLPREIHHRPQTWFTLDRETRTEIRLRDNTTEGEPLRPFGWIVHVHKANPGYIARCGLHRVLSWPFLFKNYAVRDLAEFLEIYGLPLRLGTYPPGASREEKMTLLQAVMNIGHHAAGIIPEGMQIEFQAAAQGAHDPFEAMIVWAERSISKAILGGTLTSQADGRTSTNALGNVHNEVRRDLTVSDASQLQRTLTRALVYPLLALNGRAPNGLRRCPSFRFDTGEAEDMKLFAESIPQLVNVGARIPVHWVNEKLRIPVPEEGEPVLQPQSAPQFPLTGLRARTAALRADAGRDEFDELTSELSGDWRRVTDPMLAPVLEAAAKANSFEEFEALLREAAQKMDIAPLTELLARGQFIARIWGRINDGRER